MNNIKARRSEQLEQASQRAGELMQAMLEEDQPEWLSKHCQAYHRLTDGLPIHFLACVSDYLDGLLQTTLLDWAADGLAGELTLPWVEALEECYELSIRFPAKAPRERDRMLACQNLGRIRDVEDYRNQQAHLMLLWKVLPREDQGYGRECLLQGLRRALIREIYARRRDGELPPQLQRGYNLWQHFERCRRQGLERVPAHFLWAWSDGTVELLAPSCLDRKGRMSGERLFRCAQMVSELYGRVTALEWKALEQGLRALVGRRLQYGGQWGDSEADVRAARDLAQALWQNGGDGAPEFWIWPEYRQRLLELGLWRLEGGEGELYGLH